MLSRWPHFTIWNAGKQGRKLYRALSTVMQNKVEHFAVEIKFDVSERANVYIQEAK